MPDRERSPRQAQDVVKQASGLAEFGPLPENLLSNLITRRCHRRKLLDSVKGPAGIDYSPRTLPPLTIPGGNRVQPVAEGLAKHINIRFRIGPGAKGPDHLFKVCGIDVLIYHHNIPSISGCSHLALGCHDACLGSMAGVELIG